MNRLTRFKPKVFICITALVFSTLTMNIASAQRNIPFADTDKGSLDQATLQTLDIRTSPQSGCRNTADLLRLNPSTGQL